MKRRRVVHGEVDGVAYRAHFEGEPSPEALAALEEVVRATLALEPRFTTEEERRRGLERRERILARARREGPDGRQG